MPRRPVRTVDYHTGGEPFRIVTGGIPDLVGRTVLERRRWAGEHLDDVRRLLVNEPRGHADMYGAFVTPPNDDWADLGVVFFHNEGYSTACGHGTIALVTWAVETGRVASTPDASSVTVTVDVPSGRLACMARLDSDHQVEAVRFRNVPSFVLARDVTVRVGERLVTLDVAFGGAFYGVVEAASLGLRLEPEDLPALIGLQRALRPALATLAPRHPPGGTRSRGHLRRHLLGAARTCRAAQRDGLRRRRGRPVAVRLGHVGAPGRAPRTRRARHGAGRSAIDRSSIPRSTRGSSTRDRRSAATRR